MSFETSGTVYPRTRQMHSVTNLRIFSIFRGINLGLVVKDTVVCRSVISVTNFKLDDRQVMCFTAELCSTSSMTRHFRTTFRVYVQINRFCRHFLIQALITATQQQRFTIPWSAHSGSPSNCNLTSQKPFTPAQDGSQCAQRHAPPPPPPLYHHYVF